MADHTITENLDELSEIFKQEDYSKYDIKGRRKKKPSAKELRKLHPPAPVYLWEPTEDQIMLDYDGKICNIHFEKVFDLATEDLCKFCIIKDAFKNKLDLICHYINYFIYKYDYENEFMTAYMNLRHAVSVDNAEIHFSGDDDESVDLFIQYIYDVLFTPTMVEKINQMVEDNYLDDIEKEDGKRYMSKEKKHLESLEFTNQQVKIMLRVSMGMKMMSPIMFQYMSENHIKPDKKSSLLFRFFHPLFKVFTPPDVNVYNKLFVYVKKKVMESKNANAQIFYMREVLGIDEYTVICMFVQNVVISDNFVKLCFSNTWNPDTGKYSENVTGFLKVIIKVQFFYFLRIQHKKTFTELSHVKNADGLSGIDKLEMSSNKIDAGIKVIDEECVRDALERLRSGPDIRVTEEELDYYTENWHISPLQQTLIYTYFTSMVGSFRACYSFTRRELIELAVILRNRLLVEAGFDNCREFTDKVVFPYMIMGNIDGKVNTRIIRNTKFSEDCDNSCTIRELEDHKYKLLEEIDPNAVMAELSKLNNTVFTYCVYERPDLLGVPIDVDRPNVTDAVGQFLLMV